MLNTNKARVEACHAEHRALRSLEIRAAFLFVNFMFIIMALYQLKPASRSLFIGEIGANGLPYVWIGTATIMGGVITLYHWMVARYSGHRVVLSTLFLCTAALAVFWSLLQTPRGWVIVAFYIFVDILGVILVEQFWSLTNSIYTTREGRGWYGLVGTGGLIGGVAGSAAAAALIKTTRLETVDLLLVAAVLLFVIVLLSLLMGRLGMYCEIEHARKAAPRNGWRALTRSRYLLLIASILLLAQLASPLIEFQFLKTVEGAYGEQEARTAFLSLFFGLMGIVSIGVNLVLTPLIHRTLGVIAGLLVQPLMMALCSFGFLFHPTVVMGSVTKISDRGLSYSINRASKELLYVPVNSVLIYQAKAWIDMFGYRIFKVFSSLLILLLTQWLPFRVNVPQLSWLIVGLCMAWVGILMVLRADYRLFASS